MNGIKRNRKGFTLMEVMVSIALIGILFTPMLAFFSNSTQTNIRIKNLQRATTAAQAVMEEFRSYERIEDMVGAYWSAATGGAVFQDSGYSQTFDNIYVGGSFVGNKKFFFQKNGIKSDGKEYVARVEVDTTKYDILNNEDRPVISSLGTETTVVAKEKDETSNKIREFEQLYFNKTGLRDKDEDYFAEHLLKTTKVVIKDTDESGTPISDGMVHVRVYSEYTLTGPTVDGCENAQVGEDIYDGLMEEKRMKGIYVFFNFDVTSTGSNFRKISQNMEVIIDYHNSPADWQCGYTVYAVCQGIHVMDTDQILKDEKDNKAMTNFVTLKGLEMHFTSTSHVSGQKAKVWTNFPADAGSVCGQSPMDTIVGTEKIKRLAKLTVNIYNKDDTSFSHPVTIESTRGE